MTKIEYRNPLDVTVSKIFGLFDVFRYTNNRELNDDQIQIVLLFLSLYREEIFDSKSANTYASFEECKAILHAYLKESSKYNYYKAIIEKLDVSLSNFEGQMFARFMYMLKEIDYNFLCDHFSQIFDDILYRILDSQGYREHAFIQSREINRFLLGLAKSEERLKIFNPFAGVASLALDHAEQVSYFGQEINPKVWVIGMLRLMAYDIHTSSSYVCEDTILCWPNKSEKFDLIIANPPLGIRLDEKYRTVEPDIRTMEEFIIEKSLDSLNDKGKLIVILPQNFLFRGRSEKQLRERLINEDIIETIISLPAGLLLNTSTPISIVIFDKAKKLPGKVRFIDGTNFVEVKSSKEKLLNENELLKYINNFKENYSNHEFIGNNSLVSESSAKYYTLNSGQQNEINSNSERIVDNFQIKSFDYNLNVPRYFQKNIDGIKLKELLSIYGGIRGDLPSKGKIVQIRELKDDRIDFKLDLNNVSDSELLRSSLRLINESCLLVAKRWNKLKPTLYQFNGNPICIDQDILSFKIKEQVVDPAYLINELHADYVTDQLLSFRKGAVIPVISLEDLLDVVIKLPSLEEQRGKVKGINELSNKIAMLQEQRNELAHGIEKNAYESFSSIKHSLGTPLLNIGASLRNIEKALTKNHYGWEQIILSQKYDITLRDSFDSIHNNIEFINAILKNNDFVLDVSKYSMIEMDFVHFIKRFVKKVRSAQKGNVKTKLAIHPDIKTQFENQIEIKGNSELLEIALNSIVENADMHAFIDNSKGYYLEFRISLLVELNTYVKIEIANNGKPFPQNYSLDKLIRKNSFAGETGNTGQGGYDLNEIIKYHNGGKSTLDLIISDFPGGYPTTYLFLIPINN